MAYPLELSFVFDSKRSLPQLFNHFTHRLPNTIRGLALSVQDIPGAGMSSSNTRQYDYDRTDAQQQIQQQQQQQQRQQQQENNQFYNQPVTSSSHGTEGMNLNRRSMLVRQ